MHNSYFRFVQKSSSLMSFSCFSKYFFTFYFFTCIFVILFDIHFFFIILYIPILSFFFPFSHLHTPSQGKPNFFLSHRFIYSQNSHHLYSLSFFLPLLIQSLIYLLFCYSVDDPLPLITLRLLFLCFFFSSLQNTFRLLNACIKISRVLLTSHVAYLTLNSALLSSAIKVLSQSHTFLEVSSTKFIQIYRDLKDIKLY